MGPRPGLHILENRELSCLYQILNTQIISHAEQLLYYNTPALEGVFEDMNLAEQSFVGLNPFKTSSNGTLPVVASTFE